MTFLHYDDPRFLKGLSQHEIPEPYGYRVLNTGLSGQPFAACFSNIDRANQSNRLFHVDRILGGMPFIDIDGIKEIAQGCHDNPSFLGFQAHEWENGPLMDLLRIGKRFTQTGTPFDAEHFEPYRNRSQDPYFSSGNYDVYKNLPHTIRSHEELRDFYRGFLSYFSSKANGQLLAVNGSYQLHHLATKIGVRSLVAEVGNQVPLSCIQIAAARGAARQAHKPFGVYYEPWGGKPSSCTSSMPWSPWFREDIPLGKADNGLGLPMGSGLGSSRSLQKRLLYYSWLSGAAFVSEEWGAENYFSDWENFTLTEYGHISIEFQKTISPYSKPQHLVPLALVMPPGVVGIDNTYLTREDDSPIFKFLEADTFHHKLRRFAHQFLAAKPPVQGHDDYNLTSSPYISSFDILGHDAPPSLLDKYQCVVYFEQQQMKNCPLPPARKLYFDGSDEQIALCREVVDSAWPLRVEGEVGCAMAVVDNQYMVGIFNNLGVTKEHVNEVHRPEATRSVTLHGDFREREVVCGSEFICNAQANNITLSLPAGEIFLMITGGHVQ
jgi:hypothetical protein